MLHGLVQRRKLGTGDVQLVAEAQKRIDDYESGLAGVIPETRPSATEATGRLLAGEEARESGEVMYRLYSAHPHGSSHLLFSGADLFSDAIAPARTALLGSMLAFEAFASYMGWGGRPAWMAWARRTFNELAPTWSPDESEGLAG